MVTQYASRAYAGASDLPLIIDFTRRETARRSPDRDYWHVGDATWQLYALGPSEDLRLWFDRDELAGFVSLEPPAVMHADARDGTAFDPELAGQMLDWAEARARTHWARQNAPLPVAYQPLGTETLSISVRESDERTASLLRARGYARSERGGLRFARSLVDPVPLLQLAPGMRLRHPTDGDVEARVDVHRDAWSVWGPSGFSEELYRRLRATPGYDDELDVVLEDESGRFVSYCICWADDASGIGYFEPVGTRPAFAGRGLGKAVILEGLRRLREHGMHTARVGTASINDGAAGLYRSAGFKLADREWFYTRAL